jgi:hypothetical protein
MTDRTIELDKHRGMAAQKATELRRLVTEVAAERARLQARQDELERFLSAAPALTWSDAVEKTRYLLTLFATCPEAEDPRRQKLIADLLRDFERLLGESGHGGEATRPQPDLLPGPQPGGS